MSDRLYFPVPDECDNMLAQRFLRDKCGLSARIITRLKREKDGILIDGKILRTIDCVQSGKTVSIAIPDEKCKIEPTKGKLDIRYEDDHFLVVNKPHSMPVHPVKQHQSDTLANIVILHSVFMILKPDGLGYDRVYYNSVYFLASKNGLTKFFFPAVISGFVCCEFNSKKYKRRAIGIAGLCLILSIVVHSTTTMIGLIVCISLFCLSKSGRGKKLPLNVNRISILILAVALIASLAAFNGWLNYIVSSLSDAQKATNYLDRVVIWKKAISLITNSPFLGYGMPYNGGHINVNGKYMYSHNGYLEFFLYGGIIGFLLCLRQLIFVLRARSEINRDSICIPVVCGIVGFVIMMITESHVSTIAYWGFFVMFEQLLNYEKNLGSSEGAVHY